MLQITTGIQVFKINGKPYQKGAYELIVSGNNVGVSRQATYDPIVHPTVYTDWRDEAGNPFGTLQSLIDYATSIFF